MQVWVSDRYVGELNVPEPSGHRLRIATMDAFDWNEPTTAVRDPDVIDIEVARRSIRISKVEMEKMRAPSLEAIFVGYASCPFPENARIDNNMEANCFIVTWRVLKLPVEQYEEIFDMREFEPG